jgi:hypothetical protein
MGRRTGYIFAAAVVALAFFTLMQRAPEAQAAPMESARRWEYASLRYRLVETKWIWRSPTENWGGEKEELYRKLGGASRQAPGEIWYGEIVNLAGQQGWEMVTVLDRDQGTEVWFKRPAR